jgi:hypothetical protein
LIGVPAGIILNEIGILQLIRWLKDKNTSYIFDERNLLPKEKREKIN